MRDFTVVTTKNWLAEQFKPFGAKQSFGFDINPETALHTYWWAPGAWVASARKAGVVLPLLSCGVDWLPNLPEEYRGRKVQNKLLREIYPGVTAETFAKLPEVKHDGVPAKLYGPKCYLRETLEQYHLPEDAIWQLSEPVEFASEARFWIANGAITARSWYRKGDIIWGDGDWRLDLSDGISRLGAFVVEVVRNSDCPPGFVLDVGFTTAGMPLVVEANAAWSSGPYDGHPAGILEAIKASHDFSGEYPEWAWRHSPVFDRVRPLKVCA